MSVTLIHNNIVIVVIEHDEKRSGLSNAPVVIEYDNNRTDNRVIYE